MQCKSRRSGEAIGWGLMIVVTMTGLGGCASPPAAGPLMQVVERALKQEQVMLRSDQQRTSAWMQQQQAALKAAFEADLDEQTTFERGWIDDHVAVYVAAREAMVRHELQMQQEYEMRRQNMDDALTAQLRARQLIEQQDALLASVPDARRWLQQQEGK